MTFSRLPLGYCTNVHPGTSLPQVENGLSRYTCEVQRQLGRPIAAGLWLAAPVIRELMAPPNGVAQFSRKLGDFGLVCYTLNAFPYGDFHSDRVKEEVYRPDWTTDARRQYTIDCARVLGQLLPSGVEGSISTVPLAFKRLVPTEQDGFYSACIRQVLATARALREIQDRTGRTIRLAIEPEPLCELETTVETVEFFRKLRREAERDACGDLAREFLGVCYDICHQSVEFEDVRESIELLSSEGIRINKVHVSCAIELSDPLDADARAALARFVEPRYLHQTFARSRNGQIARVEDLNLDLTQNPAPSFLGAECWRVHFHVPVNADRLGILATTRPDMIKALEAIGKLPYAPHLEVETYTWDVLPDGQRTELVRGLTHELSTTYELLARLATCPENPGP